MWADNMLDTLAPPRQTGKGLQLATMTGADTCQIGNLALTKDDLLIAEHLKGKIWKGEGLVTQTEEMYFEPLKAGDMVLVYQINDAKFVIIEKVVSA